MSASAPVQVVGEVAGVRRVGPYHHLTLSAPGVPDGFRPGSFVTLSVAGDLSPLLLPRSFLIHRARVSAFGGTLEVVFEATEPGTRWLSRLGAGARLAVLGPLGRPFALPREQVTCTLVGAGEASACLFPLADNLLERGCTVHLLLTAATEARLFGARDARRVARSVVLSTEDGSAGMHGDVADVLPALIASTGSDVVYASGPTATLRAAAKAAADEGTWYQGALHSSMPCGTGICMACGVTVPAEGGGTTLVRACVDGPVLREAPR